MFVVRTQTPRPAKPLYLFTVSTHVLTSVLYEVGVNRLIRAVSMNTGLDGSVTGIAL